MLINQQTAISTARILLVPYEKSHVLTYHEWMKDAEIQATTASEPLSLTEEYSMQASWRTDHDKLTFISCLPLPSQPPSRLQSQNEAHVDITPGFQDSPTRMLGDVNLFLTPSDDDADEDANGDEDCINVIGELELMVASTAHRHQGYGRATILSFMRYVQLHLGEILEEYGKGSEREGRMRDGRGNGDGNREENGGKRNVRVRLSRLRVKIGSENEKSIGLFESIGFLKTKEGPNYFGEVELRFGSHLDEGTIGRLLRKFRIEEYREVKYLGDES